MFFLERAGFKGRDFLERLFLALTSNFFKKNKNIYNVSQFENYF